MGTIFSNLIGTLSSFFRIGDVAIKDSFDYMVTRNAGDTENVGLATEYLSVSPNGTDEGHIYISGNTWATIKTSAIGDMQFGYDNAGRFVITYNAPTNDPILYIDNSTGVSTFYEGLRWQTTPAPTAGQVIGASNVSGDLEWIDIVSTPGSSTDNAIVRWDGTGANSLLNSGLIISDNNKLTIPDNSNEGAMNITERSTVPSSPTSGDVYLDDGTNTASSNPGWRRYTGTDWEDIYAGASSGAVVALDAVINVHNPLLYYKMNDASGDITNYGSWSSMDAGTSSISYATGTEPYGSYGAIGYNATSDYIVTNSTPPDNFPTQTLGVLVNLSSSLSTDTRMWQIQPGGNFMNVASDLSSISAWRDTDGTNAQSTTSSEGIDADTWTMLWMTYDHTGDKIVRIYKDIGSGAYQLAASETAGTSTLATIGNAMYIGNRSAGDRGGDMDIALFVIIPDILTRSEMSAIGAAAFGLAQSTRQSFARLSHVESGGTNGGSITASAWNQLVVNVEEVDDDNIVSISSNGIYLIAGEYRITARQAIGAINRCNIRFYNNTTGNPVYTINDGTYTANGLNGRNLNTGAVITDLSVEVIYTSNGTDELIVEVYGNTTVGTNDLGTAVSNGDDERYLVIEIWKLD